jgi:hypothetical protein
VEIVSTMPSSFEVDGIKYIGMERKGHSGHGIWNRTMVRAWILNVEYWREGYLYYRLMDSHIFYVTGMHSATALAH